MEKKKISELVMTWFCSPDTNTFEFCHMLLDQHIDSMNLQTFIEIPSGITHGNKLIMHILVFRGGHKLYGHTYRTEKKMQSR